MIKKITFLLILSLIFLTLSYFINPYRNLQLKNKSQGLNLVIISVDTLRSDHMGVYGYGKNTTPNIDKWAKEAFVFTNANTVVPQTYPSLLSLMTGQHSLDYRIFRNGGYKISENSQTLAKILKENGYTTGAFITNDFLRSDITNLNLGFDEYKYNPAWSTRNKRYEDLFTDTQKWLDNNHDKKFFLWLHLVDPHTPYEPPTSSLCITNTSMCDRIKELPLSDLDDKRELLTGCKESEISTTENELYQTLYDGEIIQSDSMVNKIFQTVKDLNIDKNTIIVFLSDHGESFDHNYYFAHGDVLYRSSINIPLIIKYPLINGSGKKIPRLIQNTDLFPTLLDLLDIPHKQLDLDGFSFEDEFLPSSWPFNNPQKRQYAYSVNAGLSKFAIYNDNYSFIYSYDSEKEKCLYKNQTEELYDLNTDPAQTTNIATQNKEITANLKSILLTKLSKHNLPIKPKSLDQDNNQKYINDSIDLEERLKSLGY